MYQCILQQFTYRYWINRNIYEKDVHVTILTKLAKHDCIINIWQWNYTLMELKQRHIWFINDTIFIVLSSQEAASFLARLDTFLLYPLDKISSYTCTCDNLQLNCYMTQINTKILTTICYRKLVIFYFSQEIRF